MSVDLQEHPQVSDTLPLEWKYISEGGATIVFSYEGPPDPRFDGMVLRLRKCAAGTEPEIQYDEPDDPMIEYQRKCMERLFPRAHLPRLCSAIVDEPWLRALAVAHESSRPADRRHTDHIDYSRTKAVLATDLIGSEGLAIEIKPKWGFLPSPHHLSSRTREIKRQTCRFCMHSRMKAAQGDHAGVGYCPLDLFSGQADRMESAVEGLWEAWLSSEGAINNMKVFVDGQVIKPNRISILAGKLNQGESDLNVLRDSFTSTYLPLLVETPVLATLSKLQRTLDVLDIEGLSALWHRTLLSYTDTHAGPDDDEVPLSPVGQSSPLFSSPDPTMKEWAEFLDTYLSHHAMTEPDMEDKQRMNYARPRSADLRYYLIAYLLSATFKDCSIIIKPALGGVNAGEPAQGKVTVIDLDPKSMDRLRKWEKLDQEIAESYSQVDASDRKVCVDSNL
ncbi:hypothetical protein HGRIS_012993 [Hohenbuehelia grisea]|uniref:Inositol-pentakisphosphate 2-kinase n=1 Tax=Hohenbuehelia grisea TaxID=104357 RepID=A0ABR3IUA7_9AGAR